MMDMKSAMDSINSEDNPSKLIGIGYQVISWCAFVRKDVIASAKFIVEIYDRCCKMQASRIAANWVISLQKSELCGQLKQIQFYHEWLTENIVPRPDLSEWYWISAATVSAFRSLLTKGESSERDAVHDIIHVYTTLRDRALTESLINNQLKILLVSWITALRATKLGMLLVENDDFRALTDESRKRITTAYQNESLPIGQNLDSKINQSQELDSYALTIQEYAANCRTAFKDILAWQDDFDTKIIGGVNLLTAVNISRHTAFTERIAGLSPIVRKIGNAASFDLAFWPKSEKYHDSFLGYIIETKKIIIHSIILGTKPEEDE